MIEPVDAAPSIPLIGETSTVVLSSQVAAFLLDILNAVSLPAAAPNFEEQAALIVLAKRELGG